MWLTLYLGSLQIVSKFVSPYGLGDSSSEKIGLDEEFKDISGKITLDIC